MNQTPPGTSGALRSRGYVFEADASFKGYEAINQRVTEVLRALPPNSFFRTAGAVTQNRLWSQWAAALRLGTSSMTER